MQCQCMRVTVVFNVIFCERDNGLEKLSFVEIVLNSISVFFIILTSGIMKEMDKLQCEYNRNLSKTCVYLGRQNIAGHLIFWQAIGGDGVCLPTS